MRLELDFTEGSLPDVESGNEGYYFVAVRSRYDQNMRIFGAVYLNEYLLEYQDECPTCPGIVDGKECAGWMSGLCPTTGWMEEHAGTDDGYYEPISGEAIAFAKPPKYPKP